VSVEAGQVFSACQMAARSLAKGRGLDPDICDHALMSEAARGVAAFHRVMGQPSFAECLERLADAWEEQVTA
jgi:hypothetical protein